MKQPSLRTRRRSGQCEIAYTPRRKREINRALAESDALLHQAPVGDLEALLAEQAEAEELGTFEARWRREERRRLLRWCIGFFVLPLVPGVALLALVMLVRWLEVVLA
jgi:hypothetical protein